MQPNNNTNKSNMQSNYGFGKFNKKKELNSEMSIKPTSPDAYTNKLKNIGGSENA